MASIVIREYNPDSGALLGNINVLAFGKIIAGTHTRVKVIDIAFNDVTNVGNIKLGLISNGGLTVNPSPEDILPDGTAGSGFFGIENSSDFNNVLSSSPLNRHFAGVNATITAGDSYNVSIGNRSETISNYIYLDVEIGAANLGSINGAYKIFFDYS